MKLFIVTLGILVSISGSSIDASQKVSDVYLPWCKTTQDPKKDFCRNGSNSGGVINQIVSEAVTTDKQEGTIDGHRGSGRKTVS